MRGENSLIIGIIFSIRDNNLIHVLFPLIPLFTYIFFMSQLLMSTLYKKK